MDRDEALKLLKGGPEGIAEWDRLRNVGEQIPDLRGADLHSANLFGADLHSANLHSANLFGANLHSANLHSANLFGAKLRDANLSDAKFHFAHLNRARLNRANLNNAKLTDANLSGADLSGADLNQAYLIRANLSGAALSGADLSETNCGRTVFANVDLSDARGLDLVEHHGPSTLGIDTLFRSQGKIPEAFLRGCGVPEVLIEYLPSLINSMEGIQFHSVFISYSHKDEAFAERLHNGLQGKGVRCWYAPHDLPIGARIRPAIDSSIQVYDKLLLVLSEHSVNSQWVEQEVETALRREREQDATVLFPVRLDDAAFSVKAGWPALITNTRHIGDFRKWKEHDMFEATFGRLIRDLTAAGGTGRETPAPSDASS